MWPWRRARDSQTHTVSKTHTRSLPDQGTDTASSDLTCVVRFWLQGGQQVRSQSYDANSYTSVSGVPDNLAIPLRITNSHFVLRSRGHLAHALQMDLLVFPKTTVSRMVD